MITSVTSTYAKNNFGELIDQVIANKRKILIKRAGRPAVFVTPVTGDYELNFSETEFKELEVGAKEFRKSFKFNFR